MATKAAEILKIFILSVFFGLMICPSVSAQEFKAQSAGDFAATKQIDSPIVKMVRENEKKDLSRTVLCGGSPCDLNNSACMKKVTYSQTSGGQSWNTSSNMETFCSCISKDSVAHYKDQGWHDNPGTCLEAYYTTDPFDKKEEGIKTNCYIGQPDGKRYCLQFKGDRMTFTYGGKNFKGCEALPVRLYNSSKCFFCPLFEVIFKAADKLAVKSFASFSQAFATVIGIGLAIWIAVQTLSHMSSLTKQDAPKFLSNIIKQSFKFLVAFLLLAYSAEIYDKVVNPLLQAGAKTGVGMLTITPVLHPADQNKPPLPVELYTNDTYSAIRDLVAGVQYKIAMMQTVGTSLICIGGNKMIEFDDFGIGFKMFFQGLILAFFGFLLSLAFAFYLVEAVVQLAIIGVLMPFLIACWPFKATSGYTGKGFGILLNSFFIFVFMGLVASVTIGLVEEALPKPENATVAEFQAGAMTNIANAINSQNEKLLIKYTDISGVGFLYLIFACVFGFKFGSQANPLADKMAGGAIKGIGSSIATMGASFATSGAKKATAQIREEAWDKTEKAAGAVLKAPVTLPRAAIRGISKLTKGKGGGENEKETGGAKESDENNSGGGVVNKGGKIHQAKKSIGNKDAQSGSGNGKGKVNNAGTGGGSVKPGTAQNGAETAENKMPGEPVSNLHQLRKEKLAQSTKRKPSPHHKGGSKKNISRASKQHRQNKNRRGARR